MTRPLATRAITVGACLGTAALAACTYTSPATTTLDYAPSDGIKAEVGEITVLNALVVSSGQGAPGVLVAGLVNSGDEATTVSLGVAGDPEVVVIELAPAESVLLGTGDGDDAIIPVIDGVDVVSGATVELTITVPQGGGALDVAVPVYPPVREYADILPPEPAASPEPAAAEPQTSPGSSPDAAPGTGTATDSAPPADDG